MPKKKIMHTLQWKYDQPKLKLDPLNALEIAKQIRNEFLLNREKGMTQIESKNNILNLYEDFSKSFPTLFKICCSDETNNENMKAIENLAILRNQVNSGNINEMQGEYEALHISAKQKKN